MSETKKQAPYGSWESPITTELILSANIGLGDIRISQEGIFWTEGRPLEQGRVALVHHKSKGTRTDFVPTHINVRTRVHEYGGICYVPFQDQAYFVNFSDQRLYCGKDINHAKPITPESDYRFADLIIDKKRSRLICVCEDHSNSAQEAVNSIIAIDLDNDHKITTLVSGNDFYAFPRLSPNGNLLSWISWNHPNMPWDETELIIGSLNELGNVENPIQVAGGKEEVIFQPEWSPKGILYFISDHNGWGNLYRYANEKIECVLSMEAEFGLPLWELGMTTYAFYSESIIYCTYCLNGLWKLAQLDIETKTLNTVSTEFSEFSNLSMYGNTLVFKAGSPVSGEGFYSMDHDTNGITLLKESSNLKIDPDYLSIPQQIKYPSGEGTEAHAFYYPPKNKDYESEDDELPPLRVIIHGGPTGMSTCILNLKKQYWTSRGFAVLDINHRGSTGFGRAYQNLLYGNWGVVDHEDCINGAQYLVKEKLADSERLTIMGGSAGGYTVLSALTFGDVFSAGASYYGISDLEALATDTHKFESRYLDRMVGPYPERKDLYRQRSPIHYTDQLSCPVIVLQGLEDLVVRPNQAEKIVEALKTNGIPVAYLPFEGEQHGFRQAKNIKRALEAELSFYGQIFGFTPAGSIEPVQFL